MCVQDVRKEKMERHRFWFEPRRQSTIDTHVLRVTGHRGMDIEGEEQIVFGFYHMFVCMYIYVKYRENHLRCQDGW